MPIVRRDSGEDYTAMLTRLAEKSGIKAPTKADLIRFDRKTLSNKDWESPVDTDSRIAKQKTGSRTFIVMSQIMLKVTHCYKIII